MCDFVTRVLIKLVIIPIKIIAWFNRHGNFPVREMLPRTWGSLKDEQRHGVTGGRMRRAPDC